MKVIKIPKDYFKNFNWEIQVSPFGKEKCCCGYKDCTDLDYLIYSSFNQPITIEKNL